MWTLSVRADIVGQQRRQVVREHLQCTFSTRTFEWHITPNVTQITLYILKVRQVQRGNSQMHLLKLRSIDCYEHNLTFYYNYTETYENVLKYLKWGQSTRLYENQAVGKYMAKPTAHAAVKCLFKHKSCIRTVCIPQSYSFYSRVTCLVPFSRFPQTLPSHTPAIIYGCTNENSCSQSPSSLSWSQYCPSSIK